MAPFKVKADQLPAGTASQLIGLNSDNEGVLQDPAGLLINSTTGLSFNRLVDAPNIVQKKMMVCSVGGLGTPTHTGLESAPQGACSLIIDNVEYMFVLVRVSGSSWQTNETFRIGQYELLDDGTTGEALAWSEELLLGHQTLTGYVVGSQAYFVVGMRPESPYTGDEAGKGYSVVTWNGAATTQSDVSSVPLFGLTSSDHPFALFNTATPSVSKDGVYITLMANDTLNHTAHTKVVYKRADIEALGDSLDAQPLYPLTRHNGPPRNDAYFLQGAATTNGYIALARGYTAPLCFHGAQIIDSTGNAVRTIQFDDGRGQYTREELLDNALGNPIRFEVEGIDWRSEQELLIIVQEDWKSDCPIVEDAGKNWASITADNLNNPPSRSPRYWVETTKATTDGVWNAATTYDNGSTYTKRDKVVYSIRVEAGDTGEQALDSGVTNFGSGASVRVTSNTIDVSVDIDTNFQVGQISEQTGEEEVSWGLYNNTSDRLFDLTYGSDPTMYGSRYVDFSTGREIYGWRVNGALTNGAGFNSYGKGDSDFPGWWRFWGCKADGTVVEFLRFDPATNDLSHATDSAGNFGTAAIKWLAGYFRSVFFGPSTAFLTSNAGTPEGVVTAPIGSVCTDTTNGDIYVKDTGAGNTGWLRQASQDSGTFTASVYDAVSGGNVSPTTATSRYSRVGNMVYVNISLSAIDITGMTAATNAYIRGHGFTPVASSVLGIAQSNVDITAGFTQVSAEIQTDGNIFLREQRDAGLNSIIDVSQINGASFRISGWFEVA